MPRHFSVTSALCLVGSSFFVGGARADAAPWPAIPEQKPYTPPTGDVLISPVAVIKGLTSDTSAEIGSEPMVFSAINQTYTRELRCCL